MANLTRKEKRHRIKKGNKHRFDTLKYRLAVYRSNSSIYAQIIDDVTQTTLVSASSREKELSNDTNKIIQSELVGNLIAKRATLKGITKVVFDRSGYRYHGRIKSLADGARNGGLQF